MSSESKDVPMPPAPLLERLKSIGGYKAYYGADETLRSLPLPIVTVPPQPVVSLAPINVEEKKRVGPASANDGDENLTEDTTPATSDDAPTPTTVDDGGGLLTATWPSMRSVLLYVSDAVAAQLSRECENSLRAYDFSTTNMINGLPTGFVFTSVDITGLGAAVSHMAIVDEVSGRLLRLEAAQHLGNTAATSRLLTLATAHFESTMRSSAHNTAVADELLSVQCDHASLLTRQPLLDDLPLRDRALTKWAAGHTLANDQLMNLLIGEIEKNHHDSVRIVATELSKGWLRQQREAERIQLQRQLIHATDISVSFDSKRSTTRGLDISARSAVTLASQEFLRCLALVGEHELIRVCGPWFRPSVLTLIQLLSLLPSHIELPSPSSVNVLCNALTAMVHYDSNIDVPSCIFRLIVNDWNSVTSSDAWLLLPIQAITLIVASDFVSIPELTIVESIVRWGHGQLKRRSLPLTELATITAPAMRLIRIGLLTQQERAGMVSYGIQPTDDATQVSVSSTKGRPDYQVWDGLQSRLAGLPPLATLVSPSYIFDSKENERVECTTTALNNSQWTMEGWIIGNNVNNDGKVQVECIIMSRGSLFSVSLIDTRFVYVNLLAPSIEALLYLTQCIVFVQYVALRIVYHGRC
jgi:hypothetical protein